MSLAFYVTCLRHRTDDLISGLCLLTRVPMPNHRHSGAQSAWSWPLVGLAIGLWGAAIGWGATWLGLAPTAAAVLVLAGLALATGALHEDGLADSADGLLGGRTPERRLDIMKDSRIGSYGALALMLVILLQWSSLSALLAADRACPALLAAALISRLPMVLIMALMSPARKTGISASTGRPQLFPTLGACLLTLILAFALLGGMVVPALAAAAVPSLLLAYAAQRLLQGQTGDILGASQQLAFAAVLSVL